MTIDVDVAGRENDVKLCDAEKVVDDGCLKIRDDVANGRKLTPPASERRKMMTNLIKRPPVDIRYENLVKDLPAA